MSHFQATCNFLVFARLFEHAGQRSFLPPIMNIERNWAESILIPNTTDFHYETYLFLWVS